DRLGAHRARASGVDADEVALDQVAGGGAARAADHVDAVDLVARGDVAGSGCQAADGAVAGVADTDAVVLVRLGGGALRVGADEVAGDRGAAALQLDAVEAKAVDRQALDGRAGAGGADQQAVGVGPGVGPVQLDEDLGVVAVGQRVHAGA